MSDSRMVLNGNLAWMNGTATKSSGTVKELLENDIRGGVNRKLRSDKAARVSEAR